MAKANPGTAAKANAPAELAGTQRLQSHPPIFNLGKVKKRKRRQLKQGRGSAMNEVSQAIAQVHSTVSHETDHHPVVISYEKKRRKKKKYINYMGMKIHRKKFKKRMKKNGIKFKL